MNAEQENFENLRRLLALKRHEQPPPGYFNDFSVQVIARLRAGEEAGAESWFERLGWDAPWLQRLWALFETQPLAAGALGAGVCALLVAGIVYSEQVEPSQSTFAISSPQSGLTEFATPPAALPTVAAGNYGLMNTSGVVTVGDRPVSIFSEIQRAQTQPASFRIPAGN